MSARAAAVLRNRAGFAYEDALHVPADAQDQVWRAIFENSAVGIGFAEGDGRFLAANPALQRMLGYTEQELLSFSLFELTPEEDREALRLHIAQLVKGELHEYRIERRYLRRDGSVLWVHSSVSRIPGLSGTRPVLVKIVEDITERKRAEAELLALKDQLAAEVADMIRLRELSSRLYATSELQPLLEEVLNAVIEFQNADFGYVQLFNPDTGGLEIVTQRGFGPDLLEYFRGACGWRAWERKERVIIEDVQTDADFTPHRRIAAIAGFRAVLSTPLCSRGGEPLGMISTHFRLPHRPSERELRLSDLYAVHASEMIEHSRADEALRLARSELAHATRVLTLGELTVSIAHQLNQPLGAIVTNGNAAQRLLSANPAHLAEIREAVDSMIADAMRASEVIQRIRALTKKTTTEKEWVDLNQSVEAVISLVADELARNRITPRTELAGNLPPVMADRVQLEQVLLNLILNANEAMSRVDWQPRDLLISTKASIADDVVVSVQDSGSGLDPQSAELIFEPFFTTKQGGLGLGLSIGRTIVEAHGGRLWAIPNEGQGVTFGFTLPRHP